MIEMHDIKKCFEPKYMNKFKTTKQTKNDV
jgi:hypothetical protein